MSESSTNRSIHVEESAIGNAVVSGDGNTVYVIHQTFEQHINELSDEVPKGKIGPNPYKGLAAFRECDTDYYFGREAQVKRLIQHFRALYRQSSVPRFLTILGPSGCGKSSLARAGFIPALVQRPLAEKNKMRVVVLVPGSHPLEALAGVLAKAATNDLLPVEKTEEFERVLTKQNEQDEYEGLRRIASLIPGIQDAPLVILVDQFEELYSLSKNRNNPKEQAQRQAFINTLLHAASDPTGNVSVVITLRSDFLGETQRHKGLNQIIGSEHSVIVPAMTVDELHRAISAPARQAGHPLDEATVKLLVRDAEGREGALPLLQFALTRIWEGLSEGKVPIDSYREIGGIGGALAGKAQDIYDKLNDAEKGIVRRVFVGLVQLGEGSRDTRRRVNIDSLMTIRATLKAVKRVINRFTSSEARLVTLSCQSGQEIAEITHEALFEHWQLLNDWLDSSRDDIRFQRRLESTAQYWNEEDRPDGLLWRPPDLDLLRDFYQRAAQEMTPLEIAFWQSSNQAEQHRKRNKRLLTGGLLFALILTSSLAGATVFLWQKQIVSYVESINANSRLLLSSNQEFDGLVASIKATDTLEKIFLVDSELENRLTETTETTVLRAITSVREINRFTGEQDAIKSITRSPDGQFFASASSDGSIRVWQLGQRGRLRYLLGHRVIAYHVSFSPDGKFLASASQDGTVKIWDVGQGKEIRTLDAHDGDVFNVTFSPNGKLLASAGKDGTIRIWDTNKWEEPEIFVRDPKSQLWAVTFSPDGQYIACVGDDGDQTTIRVWSLDSQNSKPKVFENLGLGWIHALVFSPDEQSILSSGETGTIKIWDLAGNREPFMLTHQAPVTSLNFSSDGQYLVSVSNDRNIKVWDAEKWSERHSIKAHGAAITSAVFDVTGQKLISGDDDGTIRIWSLAGKRQAPFFTHENFVTDLRYAPRNQYIAAASDDGTIRVWDLEKSDELQILSGHQAPVRAVSFSPDGQLIASAGDDNAVRIWNLEKGELERTLKVNQSQPSGLSFSPDGKLIALPSKRGIKIWDLDSLDPPQYFTSHLKDVTKTNFSPNSKFLASASIDRTIKIWDLSHNEELITLTGHRGPVTNVDFNFDGQRLISSGHMFYDDNVDDEIFVWDLQRKNLLEEGCSWLKAYIESHPQETDLFRICRRN